MLFQRVAHAQRTAPMCSAHACAFASGEMKGTRVCGRHGTLLGGSSPADTRVHAAKGRRLLMKAPLRHQKVSFVASQ